MLKLKYSQSATAATLAMLMTTSASLSFFAALPVAAQLFPTQRPSASPYPSSSPSKTTIIPAGTVLPVDYEKEKILVTKDETVLVTLTVAANLKDRYGNILVPYNSKIVGQIEPYNDGVRFVAEELIINEQAKFPLNAVSPVVTRTEEISKGASVGSILKGAGIGAAAAAAIFGITGDRKIALGEILIGAGAGALGGVVLGRKKVTVISINPKSDLKLTLQSSLELR